MSPEAEARRAARRVGLLAVKTSDRLGTLDNLGAFQLIDAKNWQVIAGPAFDLQPEDVIEACAARAGLYRHLTRHARHSRSNPALAAPDLP
jgi:hypothetical protein